jgi:membrane protein
LAFTTLLALFPFLIFLGALAGLIGKSATGERFVTFMLEFTPSDISATLGPLVTRIFSTREPGILTFSGLFMLWTASNGIEALRVALNRAYRVSETRSFWQRRLESLVFVALGSFSLILLSLAIVPGPLVWRFVVRFITASAAEVLLWDISRYAIVIAVTFAVLLLLHRWLPNVDRPSSELLPGVAVTVVLLLGAASLFSLYLAKVGNYSLVYGSLGGIVVTLIYLYISALAFIFGAEVNAAVWSARTDSV